FRHEALEKFFQVASRAGVGIFHDHDAATGVLNKNGDGSILDGALFYSRHNPVGDFVEALAIGAHYQLVMTDVHAIHVIRRLSMSKTGAHTLRFCRKVSQSGWPTLRNAVTFVLSVCEVLETRNNESSSAILCAVA